MLKATAQTSRTLTIAAALFTVAAAATLPVPNPFVWFLGVVFGVSAVPLWVGAVAERHGRRRLAGWIVLAFGAVSFGAGILMFAPQPVWVALLLLPLGAFSVGSAQVRGMTKSDEQWSIAFDLLCAAYAVGVTAALVTDERPEMLATVLAVGCCALALVVLAAGRGFGRDDFSHVACAALLVAAGVNTYPYGGLAYLVPAFLAVCSLIARRPSGVAAMLLRVSVIAVLPLFFVSMIGSGVLVLPVMLLMIVWSIATVARRKRADGPS
jgi:hypothetical protein